MKSITVHPVNGTTELEVSTTDENIAEEGLLRTALEDPAIVVMEFSRHKFNLEEVFVQLVEGGSPNGSQ